MQHYSLVNAEVFFRRYLLFSLKKEGVSNG
jgi:hypothetical protein